MIIGISGKISAGKDTIGVIIQSLLDPTITEGEVIEVIEGRLINNNANWQIKKFAAKLKQIVSILTGISVEDLEKEEVKSKVLGEEWIRYGYADGFKHIHEDGVKTTVMINKECSKERYEEEVKINWQTAYKTELTPRLLLQYIGTDLFREKLINNIWVNALMSEYRISELGRLKLRRINNLNAIQHSITGGYHPNWIITDMRFPNEMKAVKDKGGITIRVNRGTKSMVEMSKEHLSETALDSATFDYVIDNNGNIEDLIGKVSNILIKENLL